MMRERELKKIKDDLKSTNKGKPIKIKLRKNKNFVAILLDYDKKIHLGKYDKNDNPIKERVHNKITLDNLRITGKDKQADKNVIANAERLQSEYIERMINNDIKEDVFSDTAIISEKQSFKSFIINEVIPRRSKANSKNVYKNLIKHIVYKFGDIALNKINDDFVKKFKNYLLEDAPDLSKYTSSNKISTNTANTYLTAFKTVLNNAKKLGRANYTTKDSIKREDTSTEFATIQEIKIIEKMPSSTIRNAFLFGVYTGLRVSDIVKITFHMIDKGEFSLTQTKSSKNVFGKFNRKAKEIAELQRAKKKNEFLFPHKARTLSSRFIAFRKELEKQGINKHLTFHSSRHSFTRLCVENDLRIYEIKELLGHSKIQTTENYLKKLTGDQIFKASKNIGYIIDNF